MHELEFLPAWYPQTRRRRRLVFLQGWLTVVLVLGMGAYLALADRNITNDERAVASLRDQLRQSDTQLVEMDKLDALRRQLSVQAQIQSRLGYYVAAGTMMHTLDGLMPRQMSLVSLNLENDERAENSALAAAAKADPVIDRRLKVRIQGVCPTDVDLANFMTQLSGVSFFEQVAITYAREKAEGNHLMREFEVTFYINLNVGGAGA
ncbi:MAG TPA: PilN domain-containing protein [Tepidisphaeraceae bacterium]|nr:PilN domain-containing protein [Tepidisphaeraceae bacterium]